MRAGPGLLLTALLFVGAGCRSTPGMSDQQRRLDDPEIPVEQVEAAIATHNARVAAITTLSGRSGVLELKWVDDKGKQRFEPQVNADLWIVRPDRVSLRAKKFGDVLFWMGSGPDGFWLFDLMSEPTVLYEGAPGTVAAAGPLTLPPAAIGELMGLASIGSDAAAGAEPDPMGEDDVVLLRDGGRRYRLHVPSGHPFGVDCLNADGSVLVSSRLRRYKPVEGMGDVEVPGLIDLEDPAGRARIKLVFPTITSDTNEQAFDRAGLRAYLEPARVEPVAGGS